jgi:hypothetical protein
MKKLSILLFAIIPVCFSCDPSSYADLIIKNQKNVDGIVTFYRSHEMGNDSTYSLNANSENVIIRIHALMAEDIYLSVDDDSIIFEFDDDSAISYYPDSLIDGIKSIYRESDWHKNEIERNHFEFTFTVTDSDTKIK